jgi:hypothetical protein
VIAQPAAHASVSASRRALATGAGLACVSLALSLWLHARGFAYVSDDDFARTVIAQGFAEHATLDPSGTSWLPLPFWLTGLAMKLTSPSFEIARITAATLAAGTSGVLLLALVDAGVALPIAALGVALSLLNPWHGYASAAAVPEAFSANLLAIGLVGLLRPGGLAVRHALALALVTLCRYEPWTAAVAAAALTGIATPQKREPASVTALRHYASGVARAALASLGIALWMLWNASAHDGPLHFFRRVVAFKSRSIEATQGATSYVGAVYDSAPELLLALPVLALLLWRAPFRKVGLALLVMTVALLVAEANQGAPTHHAERVWLPLATTCLALAPAVVASFTFATRARTWAGASALVVLLGARLARPLPFTSERLALVREGEMLKTRDSIVVEPCAYEHFALIAGYQRPSRVTIGAARISDVCPTVR